VPRVILFTLLALMAFAANSLLARAAIGPGAEGAGPAIGPIPFTLLRLAAGALVLAPWWWPRRRLPAGHRAPPFAAAALALFAYALPFSLAYVGMGAATGALLLFGSVQLTMISAGVRAGERLGGTRLAGVVVAASGLVVLLAPGLRAPPVWAALAMVGAGVAWGVYSLIGRRTSEPMAATARNFAGTLPAVALLALWPDIWLGTSVTGVVLALISGAVTSGLGYLIWYLALPTLSRTAAATVQLSVPLVAALGAVLLLGEPLDARLALASLLVLGGIAAVVMRRG
jgi:drug/metabolite transporter (DMT)-like permease